ncbi:hypothetical protein FRX31_004835 [Thalictrum thalictroides]|uniref:Uncharacterized protein n=1 Tax=Thalictrum thalictroides TaxID=46969 RepID=A0A7J6X9I6_THATH|nr:hypothetical protein FRX31_004835 [Thalictrum thalictroides]
MSQKRVNPNINSCIWKEKSRNKVYREAGGAIKGYRKRCTLFDTLRDENYAGGYRLVNESSVGYYLDEYVFPDWK